MLVISTKLQNTVLGIIVVALCLVTALKSYTEIDQVESKVINAEYNRLILDIKDVESSVRRYFKTSLDNIGQIYYDERIKKAVFMRHTRLKASYNQKAENALKDFSMVKGVNNLILFSPEFKIMASVNRSLSLTRNSILDIKNRLENLKDSQVILQRLNNQNIAMLALKMEYTDGHYAYLVVAGDLFASIKELPNYQTESKKYYLATKTLGYKDSLVDLNGKNSPEHFYLKEDTLMKFSPYFSESYNYQGEPTSAKVEDIKGFQYSYVLGMLKTDFVLEQVEKSTKKLKDYYFNYYVVLGILFALYLVLLCTKANLQQLFIVAIKKIKENNGSQTKSLYSLDLSEQIKKQAYAYTDDQDGTLKNTMFKAYSALKKMTPEDIRNLSIKNSLSKENIRLVYQPVVDSKTMQPQFCEVYLRLLNYYGEELMPSEFIPVLRHFNMLENLDEMMLEKVIKKIQTLQSTDSSSKISLNISSGAFNSDKFLRKLKSSFITGEISTDNVMLELPALDIIDDKRSQEFISDLTNYGVHFAVSVDALAGSTLRKILEYRIKYVKVDMSNFADVLENEDKQKQLKQILANANKNNINIIAERIETELMFKLAKSLDIQLLQGYYIGKPKKYYTHK